MIDIILPTFNRAKSLQIILPSYLTQEMLGSLIIVDDASTDDTPDVVKDFITKYPGKIIYHRTEMKTTTPALRNIGFRYSTAPFVFMGEDDVILSPRHLVALLEKMEELKADLIAGRRIYQRVGQSESDALRVADLDRGPIFVMVPFEGYFERYINAPQKVPFLHTNALIRRSVLSEISFDEWYAGNAFREELDFFLQCLEKGKILYMIPDTICFHLKNTPENSSGGARMPRFVYEYYVWKNTFYCFFKHRHLFRNEFHIKHIFWYTLTCLLARYHYAIGRRLFWMKH